MKIAIISPYSTGPMRGNITTVRRLIRHLALSGAELLELPADIFTPVEMEQELRYFNPDIIHGFHATHCGESACRLAAQRNIPSVVTVTGSDINDSKLRTHPSTTFAVSSASAIVCFDRLVSHELRRYFPDVASKLQIIPQGAEALQLSGITPLHINDDTFMLLLPAALRPVKQVEFPIRALTRSGANGRNLLLVIAGGVIDEGYAAGIRKLLDNSPHAVWLGEVPQEQMGDLYMRADLVLNCSRFEEMPNSLLEAMALGRPILASNIRGNRSLVIQDNTGWLYKNEDDFIRQVNLLSGNRKLLADAGMRCEKFVRDGFSPRIEAGKHMKLYESLVQNIPL